MSDVTAISADLPVETVPLAGMRPHPRNYRAHPDDQIEHLMASLREHGVYRPVVIARDGTILAGHGLVEAARRLEYAELPVVRLDVDPDDPRAMKVLIGDNEISHLVENDDRLLSELLRELGSEDFSSLLGTGYDEMMLASLVMVTRPSAEIKNFDAAAQWVGLPEYEPGDDRLRLVVNFTTEEERSAFMESIGAERPSNARNNVLSIWWPLRDGDADRSSVRFEP